MKGFILLIVFIMCYESLYAEKTRYFYLGGSYSAETSKPFFFNPAIMGNYEFYDVGPVVGYLKERRNVSGYFSYLIDFSTSMNFIPPDDDALINSFNIGNAFRFYPLGNGFDLYLETGIDAGTYLGIPVINLHANIGSRFIYPDTGLFIEPILFIKTKSLLGIDGFYNNIPVNYGFGIRGGFMLDSKETVVGDSKWRFIFGAGLSLGSVMPHNGYYTLTDPNDGTTVRSMSSSPFTPIYGATLFGEAVAPNRGFGICLEAFVGGRSLIVDQYTYFELTPKLAFKFYPLKDEKLYLSIGIPITLLNFNYWEDYAIDFSLGNRFTFEKWGGFYIEPSVTYHYEILDFFDPIIIKVSAGILFD